MKNYLELLLISTMTITSVDYQIIDAFIKLEYQIKNAMTHDYWPALTRDDLNNMNMNRPFCFSMSPELNKILNDKNLKVFLK